MDSLMYVLDILDKERILTLHKSLEVFLCVMTRIRHIELFGVVPGIAPKKDIANLIAADEWQQGCCEPFLLWQLLTTGLCKGSYLVMFLCKGCNHTQTLSDVGRISLGIIIEIIDINAHDINISVTRIIILHRLRTKVRAVSPHYLPGAEFLHDIMDMAVEATIEFRSCVFATPPEPVAIHLMPRTEYHRHHTLLGLERCDEVGHANDSRVKSCLFASIKEFCSLPTIGVP